MVFSLITDAKEITDCQTRLENELKRRGQPFTAHYETRGFTPGGMREGWYLKEFGIYWRPRGPGKHNRYKNFFGVGKPESRFIDAFQLNIPHAGLDRRVKGGFLKSGMSICVLHRGSLGGGRKDGSHNLCEYFPKLVAHYDDVGRDSLGVVIPLFDQAAKLDPDFLPTLKRIVDELADRLGRV